MKPFKTYLFSIFSITLISLGIFVLILFNINPATADVITKAAFFASLFVFSLGILTLISFYVRVAKSKNEVFSSNFKVAIRQSTLISLILVVLLIMRSTNVLNWWDAISVSLAIILFELYFQTRSIKKYSLNQKTNE